MPSHSSSPLVAVLTGDLIGSTGLAAAALLRARRTAEAASEQFAARLPSAQISSLDVFRGDAWQVALGDPAYALRAALFLRARLRAEADVDTRIAIGVGAADHLDRERISRSTGEAFVLSGRTLDGMTSYFDLAGAAPRVLGANEPWLNLSLQLCGGLARGWTRRQAEVCAQALIMDGPTHEAIAQAFQVRKQSITAVLDAAHWRLLSEALKVFETADWRAPKL